MNILFKNSLWKRIITSLSILVLSVLIFQINTYASSSVLKLGSTGEEVVWLQKALKEKGYYRQSIDGIFGNMTKKAVVNFQDDYGLVIDGIVGNNTINALRKSLDQEIFNYNTSLWNAINQKFKDYAVITDIETGESFTVKRLGGRLHADVEPLTSEDTRIFKSIVGEWTWNRRAVVVNINDEIYPASINAMPHLPQRISGNNFNGHFCVHFIGSKVHVSGRSDKMHQSMIKKSEEYICNSDTGTMRSFVNRGAVLLVNRGIKPRTELLVNRGSKPKIIIDEIHDKKEIIKEETNVQDKDDSASWKQEEESGDSVQKM